MTRLLSLLAALVLVGAATSCGDDDTESADETTTTTQDTTTSDETTTSTPGSPAEPALPGGDLERCENPEGFAISAPSEWATTDQDDVVGPCSQWSPEAFEVPDATDERVAAINAYVDPVPYAQAVTPDGVGEVDRAVTAVDGRQAVRLSYETGDDGLYPAGTSMTMYAVDLTSVDEDPATLFVNTIDLMSFDYEDNVVVLDRMARTLEVTADDVEVDPAVVAAYLGGGGGFSVTAEDADGEICLRIPPEGEAVCTEEPADDQVHTISLRDVENDLLAGVTGADVWRVDAEERGEATVHSYLVAPVPGTDLGAFSYTIGLDAVERLVLREVTGTEVRTVTPGG